LDFGPGLYIDFAPRDDHRWSTYLYILDGAGLSAYIQIYPAGPLHKVALFDDEFITAVCLFNARGAMMDQITAQRTGGASGGRIFGDVIGGRKETRMRARFANLNCLACESMATGSAALRVEFAE
jgi:hypothetical protein